MAPVADGFWPLAPADAGQPPLFLASMDCFRSILGPGLKSYLGIIFFLLALGMNLASTYCVKNNCYGDTCHTSAINHYHSDLSSEIRIFVHFELKAKTYDKVTTFMCR